MTEPCRVDLSRSDTYPGGIMPDADVETCLKVLRTIRNAALGPEAFLTDAAVILSHAHAAIVDMVQGLQVEQSPEPDCPHSDSK